jgi:hypothetical protein
MNMSLRRLMPPRIKEPLGPRIELSLHTDSFSASKIYSDALLVYYQYGLSHYA